MAAALYRAYGSFFLLRSPLANGLLVLCTLLEPPVGLAGLAGGLGALAARRLLALPPCPGGLEVINGVLAGLFLGATFAPTAPALVLLALAGPLALALTWAASDTLGARLGLPVLSAPAWLASMLLLAAGRALLLPYAVAIPAPPAAGFWSGWLQALGSFYGSATVAGGLLLLAALASSSRWLVLLTLAAFGASEALLTALGVPPGYAIRGVAGANAALTALMVGGLFAAPGLRSLALGVAGGLLAALLSLALANLLFVAALPPLGLPFLLATWLVMGVLSPRRGGSWERYWLPVPSLPEESRERLRQLGARGLDPASLPLRAPFVGEWEVYQGFDGPHTHRGAWRHALDFYRTRDGRSFANDGEELTDYYCFGAPVCSPAYGTVVSCRGDLPDNEPGEVDLRHRFGNHVLIAVAGGYVLLAHLQQGSVGVQPGTVVVPGQPLGRCGNSGRSPQPHLHLHVQTGPELGGPTRPFHLAGVRVGRRYCLDARPEAGDRVSVPTANAALRRALHLPVGRRLTFQVDGAPAGGPGSARTGDLEVRLDLLGRFHLESDRGARVAFVETPDVLAFHDRSPEADPLLDAVTLALGLTPFAEDSEEWSDAPGLAAFDLHPRRALAPLAAALGPGRSRFNRRWDPDLQVWVQRGEHRLGPAGPLGLTLATEAVLSDADGLLQLAVEAGGCTVLRARLEQVGLRSDPGVPGWHAPVATLLRDPSREPGGPGHGAGGPGPGRTPGALPAAAGPGGAGSEVQATRSLAR